MYTELPVREGEPLIDTFEAAAGEGTAHLVESQMPRLEWVICVVLFLAAGAMAIWGVAPAWADGPAAATQPAAGWRVMPIRTEEEFHLGLPGGEAEQHPHSITRSPRDPNILYLSHDCCQAWRSVDGGRSWHKTLGKGLFVLGGLSIEVDPVDPQRVLFIVDPAWNFLAAKLRGVYLSADGGDSWKLVLQAPGPRPRMHQHALAYDPTTVGKDHAMRWYAAMPTSGLYRSEDAGESWKMVADLSDANEAAAVALHPADGRTVYVASSKGLLASSDRGEGLRPLGDLPAGTVSCVWVNPRRPDEMLAVLAGVGLYRSTDAGKTFSQVKAHDALHVFVNPADSRRMLLAGGTVNGASGDGIATEDDGKTWTPIKVAHGPGPSSSYKKSFRGPQTAISFNPADANDAVGYSLATLWRSTDGGRTFAESAAGFTGFWAYGMAFDAGDANRFALFCCDISTVVTENGGQWFRLNEEDFHGWRARGIISWMGMYAGEFKPVPGSGEMIASVGFYFDCKVVRSTNGGRNWKIVCDDKENYIFVGYNPKDPNFAFAGRSRSTDGGATWKIVDALRPHDASILGLCREHPDTVYAVARPRKEVLRSDDRGETWRVYATTEWRLNRMDSNPTFAVDPRDPDKIWTVDASGDLATFDGKVWRSLGVLKLAGGENQGNFVRKVAIDPRHPEIVYAVMNAPGGPWIFRSTDSGQSWQDITENLPRAGAEPIFVHPLTGEVMVGTPYGTCVHPPPYKSAGTIYSRLKAAVGA